MNKLEKFATKRPLHKKVIYIRCEDKTYKKLSLLYRRQAKLTSLSKNEFMLRVFKFGLEHC